MGAFGASVLVSMCMLMRRGQELILFFLFFGGGGGGEAGVGFDCLCPYILAYLFPVPLPGPSQGSVYLDIGGLPKQRVPYSQASDT